MKSLHTISLKQLAAGLLCILFLILAAEYLIIRHKLKALEAVEQKTDFVRKAQVKSQQLMLHLQSYINGETTLGPTISSQLDYYGHLSKLLAEGGRIDDSDIFLKPLSPLSKITFDNLQESWLRYKEGITTILTEPEIIPTETHQPVTLVTPSDSLVQQPEVVTSTPVTSSTANPAVTKAKVLIAGQWLALSDWHDRLIKDLQDEEEEKDTSLSNWFILLIIIDFLMFCGIYMLFSYFIIKPINQLEINTKEKIHSTDFPDNEFGVLAKQINNTLEQLKDATDFVQKIGEGNLEIDYRDLDSRYTTGKNMLADSLVSMQAKLKTLNEEEQKRQWSNEGLAKFVDILRSSNNDLHELGDNIIAALVSYTHSNQGGLYILNDETENNKYLELISMFAFDNKKFNVQKIKLGEGILGQTFLEKETTQLLEIPDDYIKITSGLGDATPKAILMVPLKVDKDVYGIVELASFKEYKPHEIAFVEKLGETLASTLANVKSTQRNLHLIEQFQQQTEEMRAQEEEMRQNMEELQATQEEIARKERHYIERIAELETNTTSSEELKNLQEELTSKDRHYHTKLKELELIIEGKSSSGNEWELAEEVERTLKLNLEAIKITQFELEQKIAKR